ncbi:MAG: chorismate synthase [Robiginitomaculum sp.]|nr:MAG: chorismate synthase [Robiginitomaculum sp.]
MSYNTFGHLFRVTSWGESHGPAIGCVVDGCPPGLTLNEELIQPFLDARRPGTSKHVTQRKEPDRVRILSGVFEGLTTGHPISLMIDNEDTRSKDYSEIAETYRPGHADYTYDAKYGFRDYRGGGRSSARETAMRVAAGAIARQALGADIRIGAAVVQIGDVPVDRSQWDWAEVRNNDLFCPCAKTAKVWDTLLSQTRKDGNSIGAIVEVVVSGLPAGWGSPVYDKLDAAIAGALMSIPAAKGVEIGAGFGAAAMRGSEHADEMAMKDGAPVFLSNNNGGILGGISSGQDIVARMAVKPTSSILTPRRSITRDGREVEVRTKGRHDPCVGIRAVPIVEAMLALTLIDAKLAHLAQTGRFGSAWDPTAN